jgi:hypothetical protein
MRIERVSDDSVVIDATIDDLYTLRQCTLEAIDAFGDEEFHVRTGASKEEADVLFRELKRATSYAFWEGTPHGRAKRE